MSLETPLPGVYTKTKSAATDGMGKGLFATTNINTGEDVVRISSPFVAVLNTPQLDDTCSGCLGKRHAFKDKPVDLKACVGCQVVKYCDKVNYICTLLLRSARKANKIVFDRRAKLKIGKLHMLLSAKSLKPSRLGFFLSMPELCFG